MLAPSDKLRSRGNDIIQIVITRNCDIFNCANCTQLLAFRKDAREMSLEVIEEALISLRDWPGIRACFGGNPTTHSRFPEVARLWQRLVPEQSRRGLWTNNLLKHGQISRDVWWPRGRFNLNVHGDSPAASEMRRWLPSIPVYGETGRNHHSGMLLDRKDFGISEEEWVSLRERCPINRNWSAAIYEREGRPYAYFCEVGGSLDGVRGENNGLLAEPGWWRWPMERFYSQVKRCCDRGCGVPLEALGHQDTDAIYDISPSWRDMTEKRAGKVSLRLVTERPPTAHEFTDYVGLRLPKGSS